MPISLLGSGSDAAEHFIGTIRKIDLAAQVRNVARQEARSLSQICEMLLKIGVDEYDKDGHKYLQKVLISSRGEDQG
jgi:hypothetical protein